MTSLGARKVRSRLQYDQYESSDSYQYSQRPTARVQKSGLYFDDAKAEVLFAAFAKAPLLQVAPICEPADVREPCAPEPEEKMSFPHLASKAPQQFFKITTIQAC